MTMKQRAILFCIPLVCAGVLIPMSLLRHIHEVIWFEFEIVMMGAALGGYAVGRLEEKWKRDKQMAGMVAERLIGKPKTSDIQEAAKAMSNFANAAVKQSGVALGLGGHAAGLSSMLSSSASQSQGQFKTQQDAINAIETKRKYIESRMGQR